MCANQTGTNGNISVNGNINGNENTRGNTNRNTNKIQMEMQMEIQIASCTITVYYCANQTTRISQKIKIRMHSKYRKCTNK